MSQAPCGCSGMAQGNTDYRTALTIARVGAETVLCPFFGKCDGLLIVDTASGAREFVANGERTPQSLCEIILKARPDRLICGFIHEEEKQRLLAAGIDVRVGSCCDCVQDLVACFCDLPAA